MNEILDCVIIGAGPAGIEAARKASGLGVEVALIDAAPLPGGQYFKQTPAQFELGKEDSAHKKAASLFKKLADTNVKVYYDTLVWGVFESPIPGMWHLTLKGAGAPRRLDAKIVLLATGAYDSSIAFPGWDLPGIITAGAALNLIKSQRVLPGKKILLAGSGPLQLAAAAQLCSSGAEVVSVVESARNIVSRGIRYVPAFWGQWARMLEGAGYIKTLVDKKVPYRVGWTIIEAHGQERVCEAVIAKLSPNGKILPETKQTLQVDTVVSGYGLTPSTEICRLVNCEMTFSAGRGGYVPSRNAKMQTSLPGIYAAGDGAGIGGAGLSMIEGRIVGGAIAEKLGKINEQEFQRITEKDRKLMKREEKFAKFLGDVFSPPDELYQLADDETIICRCEQITLREIKEAISCGAQSLGDVKSLTRSGMGNCQGRTCASIIAHVLAAESGRSLQESRYNSVRPPIHPLPMSVIEEYDLNVSDYSAAGSHNHA